MIRLAPLVLLCGCDLLFQLDRVKTGDLADTSTDVDAGIDADPNVLRLHFPSSSVCPGGTTTGTVRLTGMPLAPVMVTVTPSSSSATIGPQESFSFDAATWMTPQTVTATGVSEGAVTITASAPGLTDSVQVVNVLGPTICL